MSRNLLEKSDKKEKRERVREMTESYDKSKTSVILMEIIISLLLFMVVGAVCIQLFVQSYKMNTKSSDIEASNIIASSVADILLANDGGLDKLAAYYPAGNVLADSQSDGECFAVGFDEECNPLTDGEGIYRLVVTEGIESSLGTYAIKVYRVDEEIYSLDLKVAVYGN